MEEKHKLVVCKFFEDYSLKEVKTFFDEVAETCLTTNNHIFCSADKRADFLTHRKRIEELIETFYAL